ncbi:MAG: ABC transporter substrate-binding protein [Rhizobiales bacterium]|nr:ABC transporter substrate-binding protein [Hyphomicrobiales bacterium]MBI3672130.1 ABC transporter substrate-binding protein [Hyphomicrobiales bacterium]
MKKLSIVFAAALLAGTAFGAAARAEELTVVSWGGAYSKSQHEAFVVPYIAAGNKVTEAEYNGEVAKIQAMVDAKAVTWDVVDVDTPTALQGCAQGALETIDWAKLGLDKSKFIGSDIAECAVPNIVYGTVYGYDTTKYKDNPPTTINDFFDTAKYPGKRGLWKNPQVNMEWALIVDGVDAKDVYKVLGTKEGLDRAFKRLDTIKKDIVWWEAGAQAPKLLADGNVVMTSAWNGRLYNAVKQDNKPFKIVWDHQALDWDWWAIPKGGPKLDEAYKFISFAQDAQRMADQTKYISYGPSNTDSVPKIAADMLPNLPTAPDNLKTAWKLDAAFWADRGDEIKERFNAWLAQ